MSKTIKNIRQIINFPATSREVTLPRHTKASEALAEIDVHLAGVNELTDGYEILRPVNDTHLALFTFDGVGAFVLGGKRRLLEKGSVLISPAGHPQHYFTHGGRWCTFWFHLLDAPYWSHLRAGAPQVKDAINPGALLNTMRDFVSESLSTLPDSPRLAKLYADAMCILLRRELNHFASVGDIHMHSWLSKLWDAVYKDVRREWTLPDLAKLSCLSSAHFSRLCHLYFKTSPMRMVTRLRMRKAEELLISTEWKLNTVAEAVGYKNQFAFSTAFKREGGRTPKDFRKRNAR